MSSKLAGRAKRKPSSQTPPPGGSWHGDVLRLDPRLVASVERLEASLRDLNELLNHSDSLASVAVTREELKGHPVHRLMYLPPPDDDGDAAHHHHLVPRSSAGGSQGQEEGKDVPLPSSFFYPPVDTGKHWNTDTTPFSFPLFCVVSSDTAMVVYLIYLPLFLPSTTFCYLFFSFSL